MPELPEVETMRRGVLPVCGAQITGIGRLPCAWKPILVRPSEAVFRRRAVGRTIQSVDRLGKRVVLRLDNDDRIVFEPRMTGLVLLADPPDAPHLRFEIRLTGGPISALWYWDRRGLGSVCLYSAREFERWQSEGRLGPDALAVSADQFRERLGGSRRPIKVALLDQQRVAGIGNLYASEILHLARIHPARPCHRLSSDEWSRLHAAVVHVLEEAIRYEGSTLSDGTYRNVLNNPGSYQNQHRVYDLAGKPCRSCGSVAVVRVVQAQRSTYFCPTCQPARGKAKKVAAAKRVRSNAGPGSSASP